MKFAKELEEELVPEWRLKYLDYKTGKKKVKAVARAISRANGTPRSLNRDVLFSRSDTSPLPNNTQNGNDGPKAVEPLHRSPTPAGLDSRPDSEESSGDQKVTTPMIVPGKRGTKREPSMQYGSFVPTPPSSSIPAQLLELPGPALTSDFDITTNPDDNRPGGSESDARTDLKSLQRRASTNTSDSAYEVGKKTSRLQMSHRTPVQKRTTQPPSLPSSTPGEAVRHSPKAFMQQLISNGRIPRVNRRSLDVNLPAFNQVRARQKEFFEWMDRELEKIENFYKSKEDEAEGKLRILREQLHEMRNRRIDELAETRRSHDIRRDDEHAIRDAVERKKRAPGIAEYRSGTREQLHAWIEPVERVFENAMSGKGPRPGKNSKALLNMRATPEILAQNAQKYHRRMDNGRDYVRRPNQEHEVPYRSAKRKLKAALKEYYRGLELLKSYALHNRTAFRKINKKYDKAVNARPPLRYMSEKVTKAWFVQSNVLDSYIHAVEDLYARYFERGNHKVAVGKLRSSSGKPGEFTGSAFRSGFLIGVGAVFAIQGLINAADMVFYHPDQVIRTQTSYLLQIYGGYFLALYLFIWFCFDCSIWTRNKINYVFIFEFDPRNHLDWRQLIEFPAFILLILGLFIWLNFSGYGAPGIFIYYPVILIFISVFVVFLPAPILFPRSRGWFVYSHWRLLLAGLYPVEFRDFFLGDMYGSLTYFMTDLGLFFCLYAQNWDNPPQCNSSHSRLVGFLSTLPGIWRALQCLRRYYDTRSVFPHLLNCGKYSMTITYYVTLSLYRIQDSRSLLALFITFATINAIYCSIWDLAMDWSLCQPGAKRPFLRNFRGYKPTWPYYLAMVLDPILRFNWIFFIAYTHDIQHSSIVSFLIAFSEVSRRGMWAIFRVENEHCANVARFKASRDVPLPYPLSPDEAETFTRPDGSELSEPAPETYHAHEAVGTATQTSPALLRHRSRTTAAEEGQATGVSGAASGEPGVLRKRPLTRTLTTIFAEAHTQDFEKKRRPIVGGSNNGGQSRTDNHDSEDEDVGQESSSDVDDDVDDNLDDSPGMMSPHRLTGRKGEGAGNYD